MPSGLLLAGGGVPDRPKRKARFPYARPWASSGRRRLIYANDRPPCAGALFFWRSTHHRSEGDLAFCYSARTGYSQ